MKKMATWDEYMYQRLQNKKEARAYLETALEEYNKDNNATAFLLALRRVVEAQGGITTFAEKTHITRQHLYRMFSPQGNPTLKTLKAILETLDFRLSIQRLQPSH